jgi:hypothetical protein
MQRYNNLYFTFNAVHVSGGFSAHHRELKNCTHTIGYCQVFCCLPLAWMCWTRQSYSGLISELSRPHTVKHTTLGRTPLDK